MTPLALFLLLLGAQSMAADEAPITLRAERVDGGVRLRVVGAPDRPVRARYTLEVTGGNGNRSRQSGNAELTPGQEVNLVSLTLGGNAEENWSAVLRVEADNMLGYEQVENSETCCGEQRPD